MSKNLVKRYMPSREKVLNNKYLKVFGKLLYDPNLFHINRRSVSGAFAVGLFFAWIPVPFQMVLAAAVAIPARTNVIISVALVWISNPITMPPLFYFAYQLGGRILGVKAKHFDFELSFSWLANELSLIWQPFLLGCMIMAIFSALFGYTFMRLFWRWNVVARWQARKKRNL